jgi:hypothetical protein
MSHCVLAAAVARYALLIAALLCAACVATNVNVAPPFGPAFRQHFLMAANYTNYNHGSYGTVPRVVHDAQNAYSLQCELAPDVWYGF